MNEYFEVIRQCKANRRRARRQAEARKKQSVEDRKKNAFMRKDEAGGRGLIEWAAIRY